MSLTVGTYNVGKPDDQKLDAWNSRKDKLISNIASANLDVVCLQELNTSAAMKTWWNTQFAKIGYAVHYHACKETSGVAVIYKKDKFALKQEVKEVFKSDGLKKAVMQVDLQDMTTLKTIRVASMHLFGGPDKTLANKQVEYFREVAESNDKGIAQIILAGDFNSESFDQPCKKLARKTAYIYETVEKNKQGQKIITTSNSKRKIDWIYVGHKNPSNKENLEPIAVPNQQERASDHYLHAIRVTTDAVASHYGPEQTSIPFPNALQELLDARGQLTRYDVQKHYNIDKHEATAKIKIWIADDILVQNGTGKETVYVAAERRSRPSKANHKDPDCLQSFLQCFIDFFAALASALSGGRSRHRRKHRYTC